MYAFRQLTKLLNLLEYTGRKTKTVQDYAETPQAVASFVLVDVAFEIIVSIYSKVKTTKLIAHSAAILVGH